MKEQLIKLIDELTEKEQTYVFLLLSKLFKKETKGDKAA